MDNLCEHEDDLRNAGWVPEISLIVWAKEGDEDRKIHYHGPREQEDLTALIGYLKGLQAQ